MCFVLSCTIGFAVSLSAESLSQNSKVDPLTCTPRSRSKPRNQTTSHTVLAMDRYSASAHDRETVDCFFVFHESNDSPSLMQKPVIDLRLIGQVA